MVVFTPDQLALLQAALTPPMPPLSPPPQMASGPAPAAAGPQPPGQRASVPLALVGVGYALVALLGAGVSLAAPRALRDSALAGLAPLLALALGLHALALPGLPLAQCFALLCAAGAPLACFAPQPWGVYAGALALSAFFPLALPRGPARWGVLAGARGVLLGGALLGAGLPPRAGLGVALASLALQCAGALHRLGRCTLRLTVLE